MELDNKNRELLKTLNSEKELSKKIDKLLKTLVIEMVTSSGGNCSKRRETVVPNKIPKTSFIPSDKERDEPNKAAKTSLIHNEVKIAVPNKDPTISLAHNEVKTVVPQKGPETSLIHTHVKTIVPNEATDTSFIQSEEEIAVPKKAPQTSLIHNEVKKVLPHEVAKTSLVHALAKIVQIFAPQTSWIHNEVKTAIPIKALKASFILRDVEAVVQNKAPKASFIRSNEDGDVPNKAAKTSLINNEVKTVEPNKAPKASFTQRDEERAVRNKTPNTSLVHPHVKTVLPKETTKTCLINSNVKTLLNNVPKTSLKNSDTSPITVNVSPQKYYLPIASILSYTKKPSVPKIDTKNSPITALFSPKKSKQEMVENSMESIQRILTNDKELRPFRQINLNHIFNTQIQPTRKVNPLFAKQKVFVTGQQKTPRDNEQTREDKGTPKKTKPLTENQQMHEKTSPANSTALQNQQTTERPHQKTEKDQQRQEQSSITINYAPKFSSIKSSSELKDKSKSVKLNIQEGETSSQLPNVQNSPLIGTSTSKADIPEQESSENLPAFSPIMKIVPNTSREGELIVIKVPDESDFDGDAFIPPIANEGYVVASNIIKIEALDEDTESEEAHYDARDDIKQYRQETGEVSEPAKFNPKTDEFSDIVESIIDRTNVTWNELYSICDLPAKQTSEINLQVSDFTRDLNDLGDSADTLKQYYSTSQLELFSPDSTTDFYEVPYLDAYRSCDEFDETLKQPTSNIKVLESMEESDTFKDSPSTEQSGKTITVLNKKPIDTRRGKPPKILDPDDNIE